MKPSDPPGEQVLDLVLTRVRETRRRRKAAKVAVASAGVALWAWMAILRPLPAPPNEVQVADDHPRRTEPPEETLAVVVWRAGVPRLEELGGDQLADLELDFSLEPVAAYVTEDLMFPPGG